MKYFLYVVLMAVVIGFISGGVHLYRVAQKNKKEMSQYQNDTVKLDKKLGKVLVVYYSKSGHTKEIAERIKAKTNADMYEIKTAEELPKSPLLHLAIKQQLASGEYPALAGKLPDFSQYDMIFVGAPVWWYTMATPGLSFLKQADFQGKKWCLSLLRGVITAAILRTLPKTPGMQNCSRQLRLTICLKSTARRLITKSGHG